MHHTAHSQRGGRGREDTRHKTEGGGTKKKNTEHQRKTKKGKTKHGANRSAPRPTAPEAGTTQNKSWKGAKKKRERRTEKKQKQKNKKGAETQGGRAAAAHEGPGTEAHRTNTTKEPRETRVTKQQGKKSEGATHKQGKPSPEGAEQTKKATRAATGKVKRTKTRPGGRPALPGQDTPTQAHAHGTRAWTRALQPAREGVAVHMQQPRCTGQEPRRKADGTGNRTCE